MATSHHTHDASSIAKALTEVEAYCAEQKLKLTPVRRRVLEILLQEHRAFGAYEVLSQLQAEGLGSQPPIAYRALDFLVSNGFAHRVENLNGFVACVHPGEDHAPTLLVCRDCKSVSEAPASLMTDALGRVAAESGFSVDPSSVEVQGVCSDCQEATK
ncbi:Fur family transcriptional regulator [Shimia ponticola]|uniref:Fur family transcriptional regulator n=1 Tax=Shimia ponticola TaxID=2582893 RepID=UPI0011BD6C86|nr:transcriptional repressor [Shimia ponticola]